ncbi:hypothetical protein F7725_022498 [Dissostichus mawsoni]|uniref:Uncharacterized protein n=1 Tax=Dissostichus mawsoni TaxID=36200 RepID=A0A7J5YZ35_DISMA|nr:hypothetical protein F7725_022498 [Dissostichus mawsoni]
MPDLGNNGVGGGRRGEGEGEEADGSPLPAPGRGPRLSRGILPGPGLTARADSVCGSGGREKEREKTERGMERKDRGRGGRDGRGGRGWSLEELAALQPEERRKRDEDERVIPTRTGQDAAFGRRSKINAPPALNIPQTRLPCSPPTPSISLRLSLSPSLLIIPPSLFLRL